MKANISSDQIGSNSCLSSSITCCILIFVVDGHVRLGLGRAPKTRNIGQSSTGMVVEFIDYTAIFRQSEFEEVTFPSSCLILL